LTDGNLVFILLTKYIKKNVTVVVRRNDERKTPQDIQLLKQKSKEFKENIRIVININFSFYKTLYL
jgi:hypothetical protein